MIKEIVESDVQELAIDLEHHNIRSYQGFTCLMQMSTRSKDYIIDTLQLRHKLQDLNEVSVCIYSLLMCYLIY